jgi:hypothetical protein
MSKAFDVMQRFFQDDQWPAEQQGDRLLLRLEFAGKNGRWPCYAETKHGRTQYLFYSACPVNVPEDKRVLVTEYLTRANLGLLIGNFEIDLASGDIVFKTSMDVEGIEPQPILVRHLAYANVTTMDQYLPGLLDVLYRGVSPVDAIAKVERRPGSAPD